MILCGVAFTRQTHQRCWFCSPVCGHSLQLTRLAPLLTPPIRSERELLQEQAVSLQQEVSAWQQGSMLRGGASGAEVAADATLERSPSRTLASRVRELVGSRSSPGSASSSRAASPVPQRPLQQGLEAAVLRRTATPAGMPALAEEEDPEAAPADGQLPRPLQQSLGRVARMASPAVEKRSAERAALEVQEAQLRAAVTEAEALRSRAAAAEAAAQAVLDLHAAGAAAACPAAELEGEEAGHGRCLQTIEGLFAQVGVRFISSQQQRTPSLGVVM